MSYKKAFKKENVFINDFINNKVTCDDIDLYVEDWNEHNHYGVSLYDFLGINKEQYFKWLKNPDDLEIELNHLKNNKKAKIAKQLIKIAKQLID